MRVSFFASAIACSRGTSASGALHAVGCVCVSHEASLEHTHSQLIALPVVLIVAGAFWYALSLIQPPPQKVIVMSTGSKSGGFHAFGLRYQAVLQREGVKVELINFKGGSDALKAVLGGSADVVSGYFDHCVNLAAKKQEMQSFVIYDRYPGLVLVVSPKHTASINSIKDLAGKKVGVSAPGSSTDFFLKYLLKKNGLDPASASVIGVGLGATAVAAMQQGQIEAAVMLDPSVTVLQGEYRDLKILADTRTQKDTLDVFGGEYPGGALYTTVAWIKSHEKEAQALTQAILNTLAWIHSHTPEEIMAKMP